MEVLSNAWYGSWRPLTNLTETFRACHLCTFNVAAIFGGAIPTYGVLPYAMITLLIHKSEEEPTDDSTDDSADDADDADDENEEVVTC